MTYVYIYIKLARFPWYVTELVDCNYFRDSSALRQGSKHGMDPNFCCFIFFFSIFNIQVDSFVFSRWTRNFAKKKKTSFISRIKLKFLIFQYISLVSLLSSFVKRIFSCKFLMCNVDGISHELCHICACEYIFILTGDYLFIRYVVVKRNRNVIKYIYIY